MNAARGGAEAAVSMNAARGGAEAAVSMNAARGGAETAPYDEKHDLKQKGF
ncbi:hypothetical protein [uncultured Dysosmobacter sp.]|uniref:hypothetical protein n=1 Tax=uncultured Dysosmobacter sp. TaxID=2591384 RepID=UPI00262338ED|nr:hypothetical protein [uncultured Dysosmobacter sp.]